MKNASKFSDIDRALFTGIHGKPVIKKEERKRYLGELKERVIAFLTFEEMAKRGVDSRIITALKNPNVSHVVISGKVALKDWAKEYVDYANEKDIPSRFTSDPEHVGNIGMIVVEKS